MGALCTVSVHCALCTGHCVCALCTVHCVLCTVCCALGTVSVHCALCTGHCVCALCTVYCALCTVYCALGTVSVHWALCTVSVHQPRPNEAEFLPIFLKIPARRKCSDEMRGGCKQYNRNRVFEGIDLNLSTSKYAREGSLKRGNGWSSSSCSLQLGNT